MAGARDLFSDPDGQSGAAGVGVPYSVPKRGRRERSTAWMLRRGVRVCRATVGIDTVCKKDRSP